MSRMVNRFAGTAQSFASACLDFNKHNRLVVDGDDVDFTVSVTVSHGDDVVTETTKVSSGSPFTALAKAKGLQSIA